MRGYTDGHMRFAGVCVALILLGAPIGLISGIPKMLADPLPVQVFDIAVAIAVVWLVIRLERQIWRAIR